MNGSNDNWVYLQCVKVRSKLRVRVTSGSYFRDANCMFPRDLRREGLRYRVRPRDISLVTTRGKYYYSVKHNIEVLSEVVAAADLHIYEDEGTVECAICLTEPKNTVVNPCGHYYMCSGCADSVGSCPICRGPVHSLVRKDQMAEDD